MGSCRYGLGAVSVQVGCAAPQAYMRFICLTRSLETVYQLVFMLHFNGSIQCLQNSINSAGVQYLSVSQRHQGRGNQMKLCAEIPAHSSCCLSCYFS